MIPFHKVGSGGDQLIMAVVVPVTVVLMDCGAPYGATGKVMKIAELKLL